VTRSVTIPPTNGTFAGIPSLDYHADTTGLSSSTARKLLDSPAKFKYEQDEKLRRIQNNEPDPDDSPAFAFGKVAHAVVLGDGEPFEVIDADNWLTKAAKEAKAAAKTAGRVPILRRDMDAITAMAAAVYLHPLAGELLGAKGQAEASLYADDPATGIRLRARPDWITEAYDPSRLWIVDYKTTVTARPDEFARKAADFGYHFQAAWYQNVARLLGLDANPRFVFIAQEKVAPYLVSVVEFDDEAIEEGGRLVRQAIDTYAHCLESGQWPGYDEGITQMSLPPWKFQSELDEIVIGA